MAARIQILTYCLIFTFGIVVGAKAGINHTKRVYGKTHPDVFGKVKR